MLAAGSFKYRITIQELTINRDAMGGVTETWINKYSNLPAAKRELSGREKFHAKSDREISYDSKIFEIRYIKGITKIHRVVYDSMYYDIVRVQEVGFREGIDLTIQLAE